MTSPLGVRPAVAAVGTGPSSTAGADSAAEADSATSIEAAVVPGRARPSNSTLTWMMSASPTSSQNTSHRRRGDFLSFVAVVTPDAG